MRYLASNPRWADRVLLKNWQSLEQKVGADWMPQRSGSKKSAFVEYGCGHYGCVYPTSGRKNNEGVVCKVSTDSSEFNLVQCLLDKKLGFPPGIVDYYAIAQLSETYRRRSVFVLWRQEAVSIGLHWRTRDPDDRVLLTMLNIVRDAARVMRQTVQRSTNRAKLLADAARMQQWAWQRSRDLDLYTQGAGQDVRRALQNVRGAERVALAREIYDAMAEVMENENPATAPIGEVFSYYAEHGIYLADVHRQNIGKITHPDYRKPIWGITDPGHSLFLPASG